MEVFKCDKCGAYIDNVSQKRLVKMIGMERYEFAQKTKMVELCPNCWVKLEDYLGTEVETPKAAVSHEPDLRYKQEEWIPCTERLPEVGECYYQDIDMDGLGYSLAASEEYLITYIGENKEKHQTVASLLVTNYEDGKKYTEWVVTGYMYGEGSGDDIGRIYESECGANVIAWMPLPEPYKEEEE